MQCTLNRYKSTLWQYVTHHLLLKELLGLYTLRPKRYVKLPRWPHDSKRISSKKRVSSINNNNHVTDKLRWQGQKKVLESVKDILICLYLRIDTSYQFLSAEAGWSSSFLLNCSQCQSHRARRSLCFCSQKECCLCCGCHCSLSQSFSQCQPARESWHKDHGLVLCVHVQHL